MTHSCSTCIHIHVSCDWKDVHPPFKFSGYGLGDTQMIKWNGGTVLTTEPDLNIESDASTQGLGSLSPEHQHRGTPVSSEELAYKLPGTASGDSSIDNICQIQQEYQC